MSEPTLRELKQLWLELNRAYEEAQGIVDSTMRDLMAEVKAKLDAAKKDEP